MKRNLLYVLALATSMVACTDDYTDWADPQQAEPESPISVSLSVSPVSTIDFATITTDSIALFTPTVTTEAEFTATYQVKLQDSTLVADAQGRVEATKLYNTLVAYYGRAYTENASVSSIVEAFVNIDGTSIKCTADCAIAYTMPVIEPAYYLVTTDTNGNALSISSAFAHSGESVYDNPTFTLTAAAPTNEAGERTDLWFKIAPQSAADGDSSTMMGTSAQDNTSLSGNLVAGGGIIHMPASDGALYYQITLDMSGYIYTYTVTPVAYEEYIYVPGNHQNWNPGTAPALYSPNADGIYTGYSYLNGGFKFTLERDWDEEYNWSDFTTYNGDFSDDGGNIVMGTPGFYYLEANIPTGTLTATLIETWGIIGDFNSWGGDVPMTYDTANDCWSVTIENMPAGGFKFRANGDWADYGNVGGSPDNLEVGGSSPNINIEEAGTYRITLYASRTTSDNIYCTIEKQ